MMQQLNYEANLSNFVDNLSQKMSFNSMCEQLIDITEMPADLEEIDEGFESFKLKQNEKEKVSLQSITLEEQRTYLNNKLTQELNDIQKAEGEYKDDEHYDQDYLIPALHKSNSSTGIDKQKLVMALSDNVFTVKSNFLYKDLWKCDESFKVDEINLFTKKIQCT